MRIGIISDIHANLAALDAVLATLRQRGCETILCAGDVVGYGPSPSECIAILRDLRIPTVRGNHDAWVAAGKVGWGPSRAALAAVEWTRRVLSDDERNWLRALPRTCRYAGIELVHASFAWRPQWAYVLKTRQVLLNFVFQTAMLAVNGHTHRPLLVQHRRGERVEVEPLQDMTLPGGRKTLLNAGSVGQSRDGNPDAACLTIETRDRNIALIRVSYDVADTQRRMQAAGLPESLIERLPKAR